jgi:DNA-binding CsgD family transcriptional regulator
VAGAVWCPDESGRAALQRALGPLRLAGGARLPCCAWERREPINRPVARGGGFDAQPPRGSSAELRSQVALPACDGEEVLAVIELYGAAKPDLSARVMHVLRVAGQMLGTLFARRRGEPRLSPLTSRELEVLTLAAEGLTGRRIAEHLQMSPATVKTHFEHVFRKLGGVRSHRRRRAGSLGRPDRLGRALAA